MWRWTEIDVTLGLDLTALNNKEWAMTCISVRCPYCHSAQVVKRGKTRRGTQRYLCQNAACTPRSFLLDYRYRGRLPEVKQHIIDMSLNASGVRDTARVLHLSTDTVLSELRKKGAALESVNTALLRTVAPDEMIVDIQQAGEAEIDAMWSFIGKSGVNMAISTSRTLPPGVTLTPRAKRARTGSVVIHHLRTVTLWPCGTQVVQHRACHERTGEQRWQRQVISKA